MLKKIIILTSIVLNIILVIIIFFPEKNIFSKSDGRVEKQYNSTDEGEKIYIETEFDYSNNPVYKKVVIDSKLDKEYLYFENGNIMEENHYKNGKKHGYSIAYHMNKGIKKTSRYENGELQEILEYYNNGNIKELSIPESEKVRVITTYYENGFIESEGKMMLSKSGNETFYDRWVWYHSDGTLKQEKVFQPE